MSRPSGWEPLSSSILFLIIYLLSLIIFIWSNVQCTKCAIQMNLTAHLRHDFGLITRVVSSLLFEISTSCNTVTSTVAGTNICTCIKQQQSNHQFHLCALMSLCWLCSPFHVQRYICSVWQGRQILLMFPVNFLDGLWQLFVYRVSKHRDSICFPSNSYDKSSGHLRH